MLCLEQQPSMDHVGVSCDRGGGRGRATPGCALFWRGGWGGCVEVGGRGCVGDDGSAVRGVVVDKTKLQAPSLI